MNPFEDSDNEPTDTTLPAEPAPPQKQESAFGAACRAILHLGGKILVDDADKIPAHLVALVHGAVVDLTEEPPPVEPLMDPMTGKSRDLERQIVVQTALLSKPRLLDFTAEELAPTHHMIARDKVLMALHEFGELVPRHIGRFPRGFHVPMPSPQQILEALAHEDVVGVEAVGTEHLADAMEQGYVVEVDAPPLGGHLTRREFALEGHLSRRRFVFVRLTMRNGVLEAQSDLGIQVCRSLVIPASMTQSEAGHVSSPSSWRVRACVWAILTAAGRSQAGKVPEAPQAELLRRLTQDRYTLEIPDAIQQARATMLDMAKILLTEDHTQMSSRFGELLRQLDEILANIGKKGAPTKQGVVEARVGQVREAPGGDRITLVGCYGHGSGGALFSFEHVGGVLSPTGISKVDVERDYPHVVGCWSRGTEFPVLQSLVRNRHLYVVTASSGRTSFPEVAETAENKGFRKLADAARSGRSVRMRNLVLAFSEKEACEIYFLFHGIARAYLDRCLEDGWVEVLAATEDDQERFEIVILNDGRGQAVAKKASEVFAAITRVRS